MTTSPTLEEFDNLDFSLHADTGRAEEEMRALLEALRTDRAIEREKTFGVDDQEAVGGLRDDGTERWCDPAK